MELWGDETAKAIANFPVSGEPLPAIVIHWLGRIKQAAAIVNGELGLCDVDRAGRIATAAGAVAAGLHDNQFPVDIFQTGSGTSSNMNANEVIAHLAGSDVHPNDHVNLGQSSNDVFPTAVHLAALELTINNLLPALRKLEGALRTKAAEFADVITIARTHLMDAVPITLGQEFGAFAAQIKLSCERIEATIPRVASVPLGGTAVGNGLNTHPEFAARVRARLADASGLPIAAPTDAFEAQASRDALVELSGSLKVLAVSLTKIANDIAWMASGPRGGLGEIVLPELQKGSSIMPGKVNPVLAEVVLQVAAQVIGNDTAITLGGSQGNFQLNVRVPLIARNLLSSVKLLTNATRLFADNCVAGIVAKVERNAWLAEHTLTAATALNPVLGYDRVAKIVQRAEREGTSLRRAALDEGIEESILQTALDVAKLAEAQTDQSGDHR
ncbi:class II fumarate hydratase [soil metagenome]